MESKYKFEVLSKERHSVRKFLPKEVPEKVLREIMTVAQRAPSWENSQPWGAYIATGEVLNQIRKVWIEKNEKKIKGYADMSPGHRTNFSKQGQKNMEDFMKDVGEFANDPKLDKFWRANVELFNSPAIVYLTLPKGHTKWSIYDLGGFGMSIMLAAKDYGVDSIPAYELVKYPDVLRKYAKVPDDEDIIVGISLGYEDDSNIMNKYRSTRLPLDQVCHFKSKLG